MVRPLLLAALALCACGSLSFGTTLTGNATVPAGPANTMLAALPLVGQLSNLDFDNNPDFESQGLTRRDLVHASVTAANLKLTQPTNADFSWLDELQLVAESGDTETVFADEVDIAMRVPAAMNPLDLTVTMTNDVTAQVAQTPMSFVMRGKGRQPLTDIGVQLTVTLQVQATHSASQ